MLNVDEGCAAELAASKARQRAWRASARAKRASLSKSHNSDSEQPDLPFRLQGSQAKTAFALRMNCETLCREAGIERVGFLTLTVGDVMADGRFAQVFDSEEASRRINNLSRRVLPSIFSRWITVTERHKNGAIHFHIVGAMNAPDDIRTGFDHESLKTANVARRNGHVDSRAERACWLSASPALRDCWAMLRATLVGYGFGRAELTPIRESGECIASYVSKYVEKNLFNRLADDYGKKLVRYGGWAKAQLRPNDFSWATAGAIGWRNNAAMAAASVGIHSPSEMARCYGPRWAFKATKAMATIAGAASRGAELDLQFLRKVMTDELLKWERWNFYCEALTSNALPTWFSDLKKWEKGYAKG